jgi:hypothetical protein
MIVGKYDGSLTFKSEFKEGSTFSFDMSLEESEALP